MAVPDSVRLAMPAEAVDIVRIQRRVWNSEPTMRAALSELSAEEMTRSWHEAIVKPPLAHFRVLVAIGAGQIVGFCAIGPSPDDDAAVDVGHIAEFIVTDDPKQEHHGRLINAAIDTLRIDGYTSATIWIPTTNDSFRTFLVECGWGADGAHRDMGTEDGSLRIKLIRLHTDIRNAN